MDQLHTYLRLASVPSPTWPALYELGNPQSKASLLGERIPEGGFVSREVVKRRVVYMSLQYLCLCSFNINVASGTVCSY
jgi:hypothetical protein